MESNAYPSIINILSKELPEPEPYGTGYFMSTKKLVKCMRAASSLVSFTLAVPSAG